MTEISTERTISLYLAREVSKESQIETANQNDQNVINQSIPEQTRPRTPKNSFCSSTPNYQNISFAGCGFMSIYHIGVASAIKEFSPKFFKNDIKKIYGCSAGSLVATALLVDFDLAKSCKTCLDIVDEVTKRPLGPLNPRFKLDPILRKALEELCPEDIHVLASNKIFISLTRVKDRKNVLVSNYKTRKEFIDALLCSCFVPFYSGVIPPTFQNTAYVDGGLSDNLPGNEKSTIRVSPFSGISSISPKDASFSIAQ